MNEVIEIGIFFVLLALAFRLMNDDIKLIEINITSNKRK